MNKNISSLIKNDYYLLYKMNQLLNVKREMFRVELRKKQNEDLFKRKRKSILDINRDYKAILAKTERDF